MILSQITTAIRTLNGEVIALGPASFGFIVRATINGQSCRIITLRTGQKTRCIPQEPSSKTHIVSDIQSLQSWLNSLTSEQTFLAS